jgi:hypothetical protein
MSVQCQSTVEETSVVYTHAMMLTCFPFAFCAILSANLADLASMLPLGGTAATITSIPLCDSASVMPRQ